MGKKKINLNTWTYKNYGRLCKFTIFLSLVLVYLYPFDFKSINLFELIPYFIMFPLFIDMRDKFKKPIHSNRGLNECFLLSNLFFILVFILIKKTIIFSGIETAIIINSTVILLATFYTSENTKKYDKKNKLLWGRKPQDGKYKNLYSFMKFNPYDARLVNYENSLKEHDTLRYTIFKSIFRDFNTWEATMEIIDIYDLKKLDRELYSIYKTLEYILGLEKID